MNTAETNLLKAAADHLRARNLGVAIRNARPQEQIDAWFRVTKNNKHVDYAVEVKGNVTPQTLGAVVVQLKHRGQLAKKPPLLVTTYITQPVADRLTAANLQFADAAGNAYLDAPGMFVLITGRKPAKDRAMIAQRHGGIFTKAGLKTLFALICNPHLATATYRDVAAAAGVALGGIPPVMAGLQQAGHIYIMGDKRRLIATRRLLDEWALAYARTLRPKQLLRTLVTPVFGTWREWDLKNERAKWGGEPAAALLTRHLTPGVLTLYADKLPAKLIVQHRMTTAQPNDEHNLVEVRKRFWGEALDGRADLVPPPLIYADLLATGDARCIDAAQMIYEEYLARLFTAT